MQKLFPTCQQENIHYSPCNLCQSVGMQSGVWCISRGWSSADNKLYTYMCVYYTLLPLLSTDASDFREFIRCEAKRWNVDIKSKWSCISGNLCLSQGTKVKILKRGRIVDVNDLPRELQPGGISTDRRQYLLKNIAQHCRQEFRKEFVAMLK